MCIIIVHYLYAVPSGPPQDIRSVLITSTSVALAWELPVPEHQNGKIIGYLVEFTALEIGESSTVYTMDTEISLNELNPFTAYSINIAADTVIGLGPYSRVFHVQTLEDGELRFDKHEHYFKLTFPCSSNPPSNIKWTSTKFHPYSPPMGSSTRKYH